MTRDQTEARTVACNATHAELVVAAAMLADVCVRILGLYGHNFGDLAAEYIRRHPSETP